jgi:hypothetical protein
MAKKNTKKNSKKETVNVVMVPEVENVNVGDVVGVDSEYNETLTTTDNCENVVGVSNGNNEAVCANPEIFKNISDVLKMNDMSSLTFTELYNMKQCIGTLNQHYLNVREMNFNYDVVSYNDAREKLNKLKVYETALYGIIENKIFDIEL